MTHTKQLLNLLCIVYILSISYFAYTIFDQIMFDICSSKERCKTFDKRVIVHELEFAMKLAL